MTLKKHLAYFSQKCIIKLGTRKITKSQCWIQTDKSQSRVKRCHIPILASAMNGICDIVSPVNEICQSGSSTGTWFYKSFSCAPEWPKDLMMCKMVSKVVIRHIGSGENVFCSKLVSFVFREYLYYWPEIPKNFSTRICVSLGRPMFERPKNITEWVIRSGLSFNIAIRW